MTRATSLDASSVLLPKRWVQIAFGAFPFLGLVLVYLIDNHGWPYLVEWLSKMHEIDPAGSPRRHALVLASLLGSMALSGLALMAYFWLMAYRIFHTKKFPPRGYPIISKTHVLGGRPAIRKVIEFFLYGILAIAISIYVIWSVFEIFPESAALMKLLG